MALGRTLVLVAILAWFAWSVMLVKDKDVKAPSDAMLYAAYAGIIAGALELGGLAGFVGANLRLSEILDEKLGIA